MKRLGRIALLLIATAVGGARLSAQSFTGTWQITTQGPRGGALIQTLTVTQDGATLTGTISVTSGRRGAGGGRIGGGALGPLALRDGTVNGNAFSFSTTIEFNGAAFTQRYSGTFEGDSLRGSVGGPRGNALPFTGTRGG